jgi:hypothetical protein
MIFVVSDRSFHNRHIWSALLVYAAGWTCLPGDPHRRPHRLIHIQLVVAPNDQLLKWPDVLCQSMREGGLLWFTDLTISDATLALPLVHTSLVLLNLEVRSSSWSPQAAAAGTSQTEYIVRHLSLFMPFSLAWEV